MSTSGIEAEEWWPSRSGEPGHLHFRVRTRAHLSKDQRNAVQAACGSDPLRALLTVRDHWAEGPTSDVDANVLFRPSAQPPRVLHRLVGTFPEQPPFELADQQPLPTAVDDDDIPW